MPNTSWGFDIVSMENWEHKVLSAPGAPLRVAEMTAQMREPVDLRTRDARAAQEFMKTRGYEVRPVYRITIESLPTAWYYYYDLAEGLLEIEVIEAEPMLCRVMAFRLGEHADILPKE
jgi:hypothetical protein